ncbi:hypothetical protein [Nocardia harenae]|uniref:hypothetical protein n=1 Tax=Nocardia harenae TaxID=358707 RepID=UPI00082F3681|nr:hypothetical protein [Nocardia harenae]
MNDTDGPLVVYSRETEILDYFGKCEACGYPARASATTEMLAGGGVQTAVVAACSLPCGWTGRVPLTTMTGRVRR